MSRSRALALSLASGITGMTVFGEEEFVKQSVHLHEAIARQPDVIALHGGESLARQPRELRSESFAGIDPVPLNVIARLNLAELQPQDEFPDEALLRRGVAGA